MTTLNAPIPSVAAGPDYLAGALLRHLMRPHRQVHIGSALRGLIGAGLTAGLWPVLRWPRRFRDFVLIQRNQVWHLSEWVRSEGGFGETTPLAQAADGVQFRLGLWLMSLILLAGAAAEIGYLAYRDHWTGGEILAAVYPLGPFGRAATAGQAHARLVCALALTGAYLLHWLQVQLHVRDMRRVVRAFNELARRESLPPVALPRFVVGVRMRWMLAGAVLCALGAVWGIGLALAAGAQVHISQRQAPRLRGALARTLRSMLMLRRPAMGIPTEVLPVRRCSNDDCRQLLPAGARFCPRCGQRMA